MQLNSKRPLGDSTTVIDLADRDEMDDDMFPLSAEKSWFTRTQSRRTLPFSLTAQEFVHKGSAEYGGRLTFELGSVNAGDLIGTVALQVRLGHWLPQEVLCDIESGALTYANPEDAWFYTNSLGTCLFTKADLLLEDQVLESVDDNFSNCFSLLFSDINTQFGAGIDAYGRVSLQQIAAQSDPVAPVLPRLPFPTSNGYITVILPFSFQRVRLRELFPLLSCKEGTVRVQIQLRPFSEVVRSASGSRSTCDETPLGKTFLFNKAGGGTLTVQASSTIPQFTDVRLVTYGVMTDGKLRTALLKAPFERIYREVQPFYFGEPKKYMVNTPANGIVRLQLPLEVNGPVEEIIWFIRRKSVSNNNEWINYSNTLEVEYDARYRPFSSMLDRASLWVNGTPFIEAEGDYFRRNISQNHRGGIVGYNNFVYGYTFAERPGRHDPSGWMNASRSSDVRLRIDVRQPSLSPNIQTDELEFEVVVYCLCVNWVRFQNGITNKIFSS